MVSQKRHFLFTTGRDGSRAFISGDFTEAGLISDIEGLAAEDYDGLVNWIKFYQETYDFVGKTNFT